jgi:hypothetical protein
MNLLMSEQKAKTFHSVLKSINLFILLILFVFILVILSKITINLQKSLKKKNCFIFWHIQALLTKLCL